MDAGCPTHDNCADNGSGTCSGEGLGQTYSSPCVPLGTPGMDSTYTQAMAAAAAAAAPQPPANPVCALSPVVGQCTGTAVCPPGGTGPANVYFLDDSDNLSAPYCYVWEFASGGTSGGHTLASGHVYASTAGCSCPYSTDPTWN